MAAEVNEPLTQAERVTAAEFRHVCGLFPTGVTVVTRRLPDGAPHGMTVSSFTSVSLEPPLVLVAIDRAAAFLRELPENRPCLINVLSEDQQDLAKRFASRKQGDRFQGVEWSEGWDNVPLLAGVIASFACLVERSVEAGDHALLIASVQQVKQHQGRPLIWCDRGYHALPPVPLDAP